MFRCNPAPGLGAYLDQSLDYLWQCIASFDLQLNLFVRQNGLSTTVAGLRS
jgi:hypothetical protein